MDICDTEPQKWKNVEDFMKKNYKSKIEQNLESRKQ